MSQLTDAELVAIKDELAEKKRSANNVVKISMAGTGAIGAVPIPGADAPLIVAAQMAMIYKIFSAYKLDHAANVLSQTVVIGLITTALGRSVAGNLIKTIPGAGSLVGGAINASVAAAITGAMGFAATKLADQMATKEAYKEDTSEITNNADELFSKYFKEKFKK